MKLMICLFTVALSAFALAKPVAGASFKDPKCAADANDPFDSSVRISKLSKSYGGQCVDGKRFRSVRFLGADVVDGRAANLRIANVQADGKYWTGVIPGTSWVEKVVFQVEDFSAGNPFLDKFVKPAHTMLRLVLKDSARIDLYDQVDKTAPVRHAAVKNLNISIDAALTVHGEYDFLKEMRSNYPITTNFLAARDRVKEQYFQESPNEFRPIEQFPLALSQDEMDSVLYSAINYGERLQLNYFYNTLDFNCVTEAFTVLDRATFARHLNVKPFHVAYGPDPVRGPAIRAMQARKIFIGEHEMPTLAEETRDGQLILP